MDYIDAGSLRVAQPLHDFVRDEVLPGTGLSPQAFWAGFSSIVHDLAPANRALLKTARRYAGGHRRHGTARIRPARSIRRPTARS